MTRFAIAFPIKPGSTESVVEILREYPRPDASIDEHTRLCRTTVFVHGNWIVRVNDIEGAVGRVMAHLSAQPEIQEVERRLNHHLAEARDLTNPEAAQAFYRRSVMTLLTERVAPEAQGRAGSRHAIVYPVITGRGPEVDPIVQAGGDPPRTTATATSLLSTTVFRRDDLVVRMFEIDGDLAAAQGQLARAAPLLQAGRALQHLLEPSVDLTSEHGLAHFLRAQAMDLVTDRLAPDAPIRSTVDAAP
jgi:SchA/CurD like domain